MSIQSMRGRYGNSLVAMAMVSLMAVGLSVALYGTLDHMFWIGNRGSVMSRPWWLDVTAIVLLTALVVFFYRLVTSLALQMRYNRSIRLQFEPLLVPLGSRLTAHLPPVATWHIVEDTAYYAFTWGFGQRRIVISRGLLDALPEESLRAVLYHEFEHASAHDPLQRFFLQLLANAFPGFGFQELLQAYQLRCEVNADAASITACGGDDLPLLSALILASKHMDMESLQVGLTAVMEARIAFLETKRLPPLFSKRISYRVSSSIFTAAVLVGQGVLIWCR